LAVVKVVDPILFGSLLNSQATYKETVDFLNQARLDSGDGIEKMKYFRQWIQYSLAEDTEIEKETATRCSQALFQYGLGRKGIIPYFAKAMSTFSIT
jgi:uncharacterized protein with PIN domain